MYGTMGSLGDTVEVDGSYGGCEYCGPPWELGGTVRESGIGRWLEALEK